MNNIPNEDAVAELLTLTCEVGGDGSKIYRNKEGRVLRIYGPAVITNDGYEAWRKNGKRHCECGPARMYNGKYQEYWIDDVKFTKVEFIQWQKNNGITPIE